MEAVMVHLRKRFEPFVSQLVHEVTDDDLKRLLEIRMKRILKFNSDEADRQIALYNERIAGYERQLARMRANKHYMLDTAGYGIFRHGLLRRGVTEFGAERFIFGSDYPTCNPAMYLGGVKDDPLLTDAEKELILGGNAKRILGL